MKKSKSIEKFSSKGFNELYNVKGGAWGRTLTSGSLTQTSGNDSDPTECSCDTPEEER